MFGDCGYPPCSLLHANRPRWLLLRIAWALQEAGILDKLIAPTGLCLLEDVYPVRGRRNLIGNKPREAGKGEKKN